MFPDWYYGRLVLQLPYYRTWPPSNRPHRALFGACGHLRSWYPHGHDM